MYYSGRHSMGGVAQTIDVGLWSCVYVRVPGGQWNYHDHINFCSLCTVDMWSYSVDSFPHFQKLL